MTSGDWPAGKEAGTYALFEDYCDLLSDAVASALGTNANAPLRDFTASPMWAGAPANCCWSRGRPESARRRFCGLGIEARKQLVGALGDA